MQAKELEKLRDPVPWNIREKIARKLEKWKNEDKMFVYTRASSDVLQCIKKNSCVTVTASSGIGKTFTVRNVALEMARYGYDIFPVKSPEDIVKFSNPNEKTLYVIDDLCGTYTLNQTYFDKCRTTEKVIKELLENKSTKIIASCRVQIFQDEQFKLLKLFTECECNLLLQDDERQRMAEHYLKSDARKIREFINLYDFFPLLCKLYNENQTLNIGNFFKSPFSVYKGKIGRLRAEESCYKYCALALCVMFNNHLQEKWLTDDVNNEILQIIENTCEACELNRGTSRLLLRNGLDSLINTFLKKKQGCYSTVHDKLFDFISSYFVHKMTVCLIRNGDCRIVAERVVFERRDDSDQFIIVVPDEYQQIYIQRMIDDWSKGEVVMVFTNINMKSPNFRRRFLEHLKAVDISYQGQLARKCGNASELFRVWDFIQQNKNDLNPKDTALLHCCTLGDIDMVEWCCSNGANVNDYSAFTESPLYIACSKGYTNIVIMLLDNKADINKCNWNGESPLFIACKEGYTDIVTAN